MIINTTAVIVAKIVMATEMEVEMVTENSKDRNINRSGNGTVDRKNKHEGESNGVKDKNGNSDRNGTKTGDNNGKEDNKLPPL